MFAIAIDLSALARTLDDERARMHYLDLHDGSLLSLPAGAPEPGSGEKYQVEPERYLRIKPMSVEQKLEIREAFVRSLGNHELHLVLSHALQGRRALRNFAFLLEQQPTLKQAWTQFHDRRMHEQALEWLQENDLQPRRAGRFD